jgi:hypothetical protein
VAPNPTDGFSAGQADFAARIFRANQLDAADGDKITMQEVKLLELRLGDARWIAERLLSKEYGNKVKAELGGADGGPVQFVVESILDEAP